MTKNELRLALKYASSIARGAGKILKKGISGKIEVRYKSKIDPVTEYDLKSDKYIFSKLSKRFPGHLIMTEERDRGNEESEYIWIVDPLDGTVNYTHGFPVYSVSIALQQRRKGILGVVYDPERDELFSAGRNLGAFLNGEKIRVTNQRKLSKSLLSTGFGYNVRTARLNNLGFFARMVKTAQAVRRAGSAAIDLAWLACGRFDGLWEFYLHPWDSAAGLVLVEEAGGKVTRINGQNYSIFDDNILASNGLIHRQMQNVLNKYKRSN
jgi:myo-inositol-1(or 4)-monophosphatase